MRSGHNSATERLHLDWVIPLTILVSTCLLYALNLDRFPHFDELYHILAARGILETGEPQIEQGTYDRVYLYTLLISKLFEQFGDSLAVARAPSLLAIASLVTLMFVWLRSTAGVTAAIIGAGLFALSPFATGTALFTRFYGFQALAFFISAALIFTAIESGIRKHLLLFFLGVVAVLVATYLQITTLIGVVGIGIWGMIRLGSLTFQPDGISNTPQVVSKIAALFCLILVMVIVGQWSGLLQNIWEKYRSVSLWNQSNANQFWFYYAGYLNHYPTLWPAIALISLSALTYRPKLAFFAIVVFFVSFLISSFAASKSLRYIIYAQPFFFIIVGIGLAPMAAPVAAWLKQLRNNLSTKLPLNAQLSRFAASFLITCSILTVVVGNRGFLHTADILANLSTQPRWMEAKDALTPWFDRVDIIVTQSELEMLYYYGEYDVLYNESRLRENHGSVDFDPDYRTGKPIISSTDAMSRIFECYSTGIFVTTTRIWRNPSFISRADANFIEANTTRVSLPQSSKILAFEWTKQTSQPKQHNCSELPHFRNPSKG